MSNLIDMVNQINKYLKINDILNANKESIELIKALKTNYDYIYFLESYIVDNNDIENSLKSYIAYLKNHIEKYQLDLNNSNLKFSMDIMNLTYDEYKKEIKDKNDYDIDMTDYINYIDGLKIDIENMYEDNNYKGILEKVGINNENDYLDVLNRINKIRSNYKYQIKSIVESAYNRVYNN